MKKLKILYDYSPACKDEKTGIPYFIQALFSHLKQIESIEIHKTICLSKYIPTKYWKLYRFFEKFLYHDIYLPFKLKFGNYDVYIESQYMFVPLFKPKKTLIVTFIYDIALVLFDTIHTKKHTANWRKQLPKSIKNSDLLITLSQSSQKDITQYLSQIDQSYKPIDYIYADALQCDKTNKSDIFDKQHITQEYFLYLGTLEPRKNPLSILKAFHQFKHATKSPMQLVMAGKKGWLYEDFIDYVHTHDMHNDVIMTGYINEVDKYHLLQKCKAFLFISLYEGFGIPPLEVLKLNIPILVSDIPVFHELFEESVHYASGNNIPDIASKMSTICLSPPMISDEVLKKFSWGHSAQRLVHIIREKL